MGISLATTQLILPTCRQFNVTGTCLTLGRQEVYLTWEQYAGLLLRHGFLQQVDGRVVTRPQTLEKIKALMEGGKHIGFSQHAKASGFMSADLFLAALGFTEVESLDANDFEGADIIWDLNREGLGAHTGKTYDMVFEAGLIEHVFDVRTVLRNLFEVLRVGGHLLIMSPSNNHCDHGFYQFSPTFFWDYYTANKFRVLSSKFYRHPTDLTSSLVFTADYTPGCLDNISLGGLDAGMYQTLMLVQKTDQSTWDQIPVQGFYQRAWQK